MLAWMSSPLSTNTLPSMYRPGHVSQSKPELLEQQKLPTLNPLFDVVLENKSFINRNKFQLVSEFRICTGKSSPGITPES